MNFFHPPAVAWSARLVTNSLELLLLLIGLYRSLKDSRYHFQKGQMRMRQIAPVLYVFYRDGTMFYIPVFGLSAFGFIASFDAHINAQLQACANWEAWLAIAYYICGTRLILNIRSAGMKFTTSMITQHISSLVFDRGSSVESDDECPDHPKTVLGIGQGHGAGLVTA
ncbi:hypothetical protein P691DRAFT_806506 [Macrolepiota fuliginosa MF-IS2]|uniref:Uncharacterized protein n=1 Tax=Macrolepiota fuliginosa MF-IS2 TaxID=1400762 RepID=A0A9P5XI47_9AGAR|nr:hypothetical protein P691DRAFT_806506 [Macrolepiota fuliginosa MF-IS2]